LRTKNAEKTNKCGWEKKGTKLSRADQIALPFKQLKLEHLAPC